MKLRNKATATCFIFNARPNSTRETRTIGEFIRREAAGVERLVIRRMLHISIDTVRLGLLKSAFKSTPYRKKDDYVKHYY